MNKLKYWDAIPITLVIISIVAIANYMNQAIATENTTDMLYNWALCFLWGGIGVFNYNQTDWPWNKT